MAHHGIDYIEFQVTDMQAAKAFYAAAFGWTFTDYGPAYAGVQDPKGGEIGGFAVAETVTAGGPLVVLRSHDLEASLGAVTQAGGQITREIFEFPGGRRFELVDPSGNALAVWQPT